VTTVWRVLKRRSSGVGWSCRYRWKVYYDILYELGIGKEERFPPHDCRLDVVGGLTCHLKLKTVKRDNDMQSARKG
jgi:hypothetical protein